MKSFIDVHILVSVNASELAGLLYEHGLLGVWEQDGVIHLYWDDITWSELVLDRVNEALQQFGVSRRSDDIAVLQVPSKDWNAKWTESVQPIRIGEHILIRPSWVGMDRSPGDIEIIIDPKQAFGTGHHVTSQLLVEWLEHCIQGGERVLDVGTGSGILAMVALRLGARSAVGVDSDSVAIACAKEYAKVNHFDSKLELHAQDIGALSADNSFDLLLANIDRRTLLANHSTLGKLSNPQTNLLVSGILNVDEFDIVRKYTGNGWRCVEVRKREEWIAIHFQRE